MSNLLQRDAKKAVVREYWMRVISVWGILIACALCAIFVLAIPTYVLVNARFDAAQTEASKKDTQKIAERYNEVKSAIERANELAAALHRESGALLVSHAFREIEARTPPNILLEGVSYTISEAQTLQIRGTARTRESLVSYVDSLKESRIFRDVEVPVSDLARGTDAPFTIRIVVEGN